MQPNSPMFRSGAQPRKLWDEARVIEGQTRQLQIFRWENRLVCHEASTESWWATLDECDETDARAFWNASIASARIARLTAFHRNFGGWHSVSNARLELGPMWLDVLIEQHNGGWARVQGETQWLQFAPVAPRRVSKPLARVPSVWSPRFRLEFGRRSMSGLTSTLRAQFLEQMPAHIQEIVEQGDKSRIVKLIRAALAQRWITRRPDPCVLPEFWMEVLGNAAQNSSLSLPAPLLESPEASPTIEIKLWTWMMSRRPSVLHWKNDLGALRFGFWTHLDSSHDSLEAKLELRDWLGQFFPADEVNRWLQ